MDDQRHRYIAAFIAMEHHVSDCWQCRQAERAYDTAKRAGQPFHEIAHQFCPVMQELAKRLAEATHEMLTKAMLGR
jgi:hypothetical protein